MKRSFCFLLAFFCLFFISSCSGSKERVKEVEAWKKETGRLKVVATIGMIGDLINQIGKEHVDTYVLISKELDPHSYQLVKGDDEILKRADLIFFNGLGLEHGPGFNQYLSDQTHSVSLGNFLMKIKPDALIQHQGVIDPHIWMDISLYSETIPAIIEALSQKDPNHASIYAANGEIAKKNLLTAHGAIKCLLQQIPDNKRYLVASHDAFHYFTRAYLDSHEAPGQRFKAPEGLAPDMQISLNGIQSVLDFIKIHKIEVVFPESNLSQNSLRKICDAAHKQDLKLRIASRCLYADAMECVKDSPSSYLDMMFRNAFVIKQEIEGDHD